MEEEETGSLLSWLWWWVIMEPQDAWHEEKAAGAITQSALAGSFYGYG